MWDKQKIIRFAPQNCSKSLIKSNDSANWVVDYCTPLICLWFMHEPNQLLKCKSFWKRIRAIFQCLNNELFVSNVKKKRKGKKREKQAERDWEQIWSPQRDEHRFMIMRLWGEQMLMKSRLDWFSLQLHMPHSLLATCIQNIHRTLAKWDKFYCMTLHGG